MAIVGTGLTANGDNTDGTSFATASVSPTASSLQLLAVLSIREDSTDAEVPSSVTGNGLTWVQVATSPFDATGTLRYRLTLMRALGSPSSGAVTMNFSATHSRCAWSLAEFSGVSTAGTNGSDAIVQSVTAESAADADNDITVTLSAFESADNGTYGCVALNQNQAVTPGSGFTEIHDLGSGTAPVYGMQTQWRATNSTTVDFTAASTGDTLGAIGVELRAAVAATAIPGFMFARTRT